MIEVNSVQIWFTASYHHDGEGLHQYKDPSDNEEYLYTQFEAFNAHKCFPCFDQPNIKAELDFASFSPKSWDVISNELEKGRCEDKNLFSKYLNEIDCPHDLHLRFTE